MVTAFIDIDGVIADDRHRVHYALERDWENYFKPEHVLLDTAWPQGRALIDNVLDAGGEIEYLTGRRADLREVTQIWLGTYDFPVAPLHMRPLGEKTRLADLKASFLFEYGMRTGNEFVLYDDDPEVIRAVQELCGETRAVHCTWHIKEKALVRKATA